MWQWFSVWVDHLHLIWAGPIIGTPGVQMRFRPRCPALFQNEGDTVVAAVENRDYISSPVKLCWNLIVVVVVVVVERTD